MYQKSFVGIQFLKNKTGAKFKFMIEMFCDRTL